jgi:hypothetical protein
MVTIELKASTKGSWSVCRSHVALFSDMQLAPAIKLAREMAREEHLRSGRQICVEMPGPQSTIILGRYGDFLSTAVSRKLAA